MTLSAILAVFRFEWKRSLTVRQWIGFFILMLVPGLIVMLLKWDDNGFIPDEVPSRVMFYLVPEVLCLLNLLLLVTPIVYGELEGKNWVYISTRPWGRLSHLLGKYAAAVSRTILCALLGLLIAVAISRPPELIKFTSLTTGLVVLSALTYGAIFTFIGVLVHRRAMVMAVGYTLVMELLVSNVPALISRFSVQYRLLSIFLNTMATTKGSHALDDATNIGPPFGLEKGDFWDGSADFYHTLYGYAPSLSHIAVLLGITASLLVASAIVLKNREYLNAEDN